MEKGEICFHEIHLQNQDQAQTIAVRETDTPNRRRRA